MFQEKSPSNTFGAEKSSRENSTNFPNGAQDYCAPHSHPSQLDRALAFAAAGIPVFQCRAAEEVDADGVVHSAKSPYTPRGFKDATTNEMVIRSWLTRWPDALIGMPTGKRTRTVVVDVDRKNGKDGFASLEERSIELPVTRANPTLSEGEHHIYSYPDGVDKVTSRNDVLSGVDIKADGGYIILHGNLRPEDLKGLTPYPQELASALSPRKRMNGPGSQSSTTSRPTAFSVSPEAMEMELNRAVEMLNFIDCDPFDNWNNVGFWLRGHFGERGARFGLNGRSDQTSSTSRPRIANG